MRSLRPPAGALKTAAGAWKLSVGALTETDGLGTWILTMLAKAGWGTSNDRAAKVDHFLAKFEIRDMDCSFGWRKSAVS
jgi:hypothetical protein